HRHTHRPSGRFGEPVGDAGTRALRLRRGPRGAAHRHDDGAAHPGQQSDLLPDTGLLQSRRYRRLRLQGSFQDQRRRLQHHQRQVLELGRRDRAHQHQPAPRSLRPARPLLRRQAGGTMVVAALSAERLPAPHYRSRGTRAPRVPMALSLALHGAAVLLLSPPGAPGRMVPDVPLLVELALVGPPSDKTDANEQPASDVAVEVPPAEEPPPADLSMLKPSELAPSTDPPPVDFSELKAVEPPKPPPPPNPQLQKQKQKT